MLCRSLSFILNILYMSQTTIFVTGVKSLELQLSSWVQFIGTFLFVIHSILILVLC